MQTSDQQLLSHTLSTRPSTRVPLQMPEQQLLSQARLRRSPLGVAFHLRDLLGLGVLQRVATPAGTLIRLVKR